MKPRTADIARGKWRGILLGLGLDGKYLSEKHGPCPFCEGRDRYRWDNREGSGSFICGQCGAGNGFDLLMKLNGWDFATTAARVDEISGNVEPEKVKARIDDRARADMLNRLWRGALPITSGDAVAKYLAGRGVTPEVFPAALRHHPDCPSPENGNLPALLAMVCGIDGKPASIHRTFLGPNGKADIERPRAMMPGPLPDGCAVRLFAPAERMGIAEGIETALAASQRFELPVWSAINSTMLAKWAPPENVREVVIFGDNDPKFGGQAAAYALAAKLAGRLGLAVEVRIPERVGTDWADQ